MARPREFDEERVLDAVMETFWHEGYEGTSAQALVEATGLGRGSLYGAYRNKDGLFEQALLRYRKRAQAHVEKLEKRGSAIERLRELMIDIVDADLTAFKKRGCLATNSAIELAGRDPRVANLVRQNFDILLGGVERTIRRGQASGEITAEADTTVLALSLFNSIQGLRVLSKTSRMEDRARLMAVIDHTLNALT